MANYGHTTENKIDFKNQLYAKIAIDIING